MLAHKLIGTADDNILFVAYAFYLCNIIYTLILGSFSYGIIVLTFLVYRMVLNIDMRVMKTILYVWIPLIDYRPYGRKSDGTNITFYSYCFI